jgi:hypothetical protein
MSPKYKPQMRLIIQRYLVSGPVWSVLGWLFSRFEVLRIQRNQFVEKRFISAVEVAFLDGEVMAGPFAGLKYSENEARGSALWPKLLGTYEKELHPCIERLGQKSYETVADWGCAEGYYLIGFGVQFPKAKLIGIDPDPRARELCRKMSNMNGITLSHLDLRSGAQLADLASDFGQRSLIICDCEGFENKLFSQDVHLLVHADILVECHDFLVPNTTQNLQSIFESTHRVTLITSVNRSRSDLSPQVLNKLQKRFDPTQLLRLMNEGRPVTMTWLLIEALR